MPYPDVFCAALLNSQPMGFYAPSQIVQDAQRHGVEVRPICINASRGTARWSAAGTDGTRPSGWAFECEGAGERPWGRPDCGPDAGL
ncbi:hypothetical protein [Gluconobacter oxydans]|uniref:hypothetical protein n=1 Tax=Gluconobacter oxydans TaxID=442 RepID=UPI002648D60F|nr:hypothetical protein [Gluconobacter oxydans]WKE49539.1 hypothetical protein NUJ38_13650 [Gluconobacter oxydans]